jgi:hypothetical protein
MKLRWFIPLLFVLPAFAAGGTCPSGANYVNPANPTGSLVTLSSLGITSCYFFSFSSGSDSNNGTSESTPQKNLPCMYDAYTGSLQTVLNAGAAGLGFIMKGGDTWPNASMECGWWGGGPSGAFNNWSGTSSNPVYIGVDLTWPSSSWSRPIWTCGGAVCNETANGDGYFKTTEETQYVIVDNIEMTGMYQTASNGPGYVKDYGSNNTYTRIYTHGWSRSAASDPDQSTSFSPSTAGGGGVNDNFYFDICDGSDTDLAHGTQSTCLSGDPNIFAYGVMSYVSNGAEGSQNQVHDTLIENMNFCFTTGGGGPGGIGNCHQNAIQQAAPATSGATYNLFYNNVITNIAPGGTAKLWLGQNGSGGSGLTTYAFNNVLYANNPGNDVNPCQEGTSNCGTFYYFNNTFECGSVAGGVGPCMAGSGLTVTQTAHWINNHCIATACVQVSSMPDFTYDETTDLVQSLAQADANVSTHFDQYTESETYAMSPVASTNSTVGTGTNKQSLCTTINGLDTTAGAACKNDTGYACSYNTSNHTISCPLRTENVRPTSAAWDIGAYEYTASGPSFTASPTTIPANHSSNIAVTLTGSGTSWTGTTTFSISGVTGATLVSKSNTSATAETLQITTGSGTGTLTITDTTDSISTTITVATATLSISPTSGNVSTTPSLTLTGTNTLWSSETASGLFSVSGGGCSGDSIGTPTVTSNTAATATLTTGSTACTITVTDTSTTATATFTVNPTAPPAPAIGMFASGHFKSSGQVRFQ